MAKQHQPPIKSQLFEALSPLKTGSRVNPHRTGGIKDPAPSPMKWIADGVDHINIWESAVTELGQVLSHNSQIEFTHHIFGKFSSMEAFWHYIQSEERDDRIRSMAGRSLKNFAKKLNTQRITNFRAIIMDSNWEKIKQHKLLLNAVKESELPFDCYFVDGKSGLRTRPAFFNWLNMGFEEIRKAIKENREPDFTFLLDRKDTEIYEFVKPNQMKVPAIEKVPVPKKDNSLQKQIIGEVQEQLASTNIDNVNEEESQKQFALSQQEENIENQETHS